MTKVIRYDRAYLDKLDEETHLDEILPDGTFQIQIEQHDLDPNDLIAVIRCHASDELLKRLQYDSLPDIVYVHDADDDFDWGNPT